VFALRVLGHDNVKVLQDGLEGWKKKAASTPMPGQQTGRALKADRT